MTTTISLPTRDCIIIGCDSLATSVRTVIDPMKILQAYFDDEGKLRIDENGAPKLDSVERLFPFSEDLPRNQLPNVTKIFSLNPFKAGLLFAGIAGIGDNSVRSLVETFLEKEKNAKRTPKNTNIESLGKSLLVYLEGEYNICYAEMEQTYRPEMEIVLSGYSHNSRVPEIYRLKLGPKNRIIHENTNGNYDIVFGGQYDVIQRVVKGIDFASYLKINERHDELVSEHHRNAQQWLKDQGLDVDLPPPDLSLPTNRLFAKNFCGVEGVFSDNGSLSEQAGINFVEFLIATMINAQEFSDKIPTVGGQIHVALITPANGFKWISKEEFKFQGHSVPRYE